MTECRWCLLQYGIVTVSLVHRSPNNWLLQTALARRR